MCFLFARGDKHRPEFSVRDAIILSFKVSYKQAADWTTFAPCQEPKGAKAFLTRVSIYLFCVPGTGVKTQLCLNQNAYV